MRSVVRSIAALALCLPILGLSAPALASDEERSVSNFGMEQRIACHRAVEAVRWQNRRWPEENPEAKPPLSEVMSEAEIRHKAEDSVKMSAALAERYDDPITAEMLQAEIERMARDTRAPEQLRQLFAALDNDPLLIAECLARPKLARRKLYNRMTHDPAIHGKVQQRAQAALAGVEDLATLKDAEVTTRVYVLDDDSKSEQSSVSRKPDKPVKLARPQWRELRADLGLSGDAPARREPTLEESATAFYAREVLASDAQRIEVRSATWPKQTFASWWRSSREQFETETAADAGDLTVPAVTGTADASVANAGNDDWFVPGPPTGRNGHTAVWTGSEMIIWGGSDPVGRTNTGGRYDPSTDTWTATATTGAPSGRDDYTAVWTGSKMIVWGGRDDSNNRVNTGGRYDPSTDTWTATATSGAPSGRDVPTAVWTGSEMIVWGGVDDSFNRLNTGGRYDPTTNTWTATTTSGAPSGRQGHTAVWTGSEMIVWGGNGGGFAVDTGGRYDPSSDSWAATATGGATPSARFSHSAIWSGDEMIVWGGDGSGKTNTGGRYDPSADSWTVTNTNGAPTARDHHRAVWSGNEMIVWGGRDSSGRTNTGGRYDPSTDSWTATATTGAPSGRTVPTAVWAGSEMIVWGGLDAAGRTNTGGRYDPSTDTWTATATTGAPSGREFHTAVWTGSEMIVWGGVDPSGTNTGGRYDPSTDSWTATTTSGAPNGRRFHTAVWTGTEMIVWGGLE